MDFPLSLLIESFLYSIVIGFLLGVSYEPVRIFHMWGYNKSSHYLVADILFTVFCGFITYFFCLVMLEGKVRMFVVLGEFAGFLGYSRLIFPYSGKIFNFIIKISKKVLAKLLKKCRQLMYNILKKLGCLFSLFRTAFMRMGGMVSKKVKNYERRQDKKERKGKRHAKRTERS